MWLAALAPLWAQSGADPLKEHLEQINMYQRRMQMPMLSSQMEGRQGYLTEIQWLIENHPEAALPAVSGMAMLQEKEAERVFGWWKQALAKHSKDAEITFVAANFHGGRNTREAIRLLKQARELGAPKAAQSLGTMYFGALMGADPTLAIEVTGELERSTEPEIYGTTGGWLVCFQQPKPKPEYIEIGRKLVEKARAAEPNNPRWAKAAACMASAK